MYQAFVLQAGKATGDWNQKQTREKADSTHL